MSRTPKLDAASIRWFQRQRAGPEAVQKQLADLEDGYQRESLIRKEQSMMTLLRMRAIRKELGL